MKPVTNIWHPCTQMKDHETYPIIKIERGEGIYLYDDKNNKYIDAVSSWWVNIFGHNNPRLKDAIKNQLDKIEHVIFAGITHDPALKLTEQLLSVTPENLTKVFYADIGSAAVESAMKLSYGYRKNNGVTSKKRYLYLDSGYHGETLGALSVCGEELYTELYGDIMIENIRVQGPDCYRCPYGKTRNECSAQCFEHMERTIEKHANEITAVIIEPLLQCAGGMKMYPPLYLQKLCEAAKAYDIHTIFDEIASGFGRTGTMFALEQAGVQPDFICVSKGLTSGYLPMSAVLTTDEIYSAFYDDYTTLKAFLHSHSFTGNPLACAVANETMKMFKELNIIEENRKKFPVMHEYINKKFKGQPHVGEIRHLGCVSAVELVKDVKTKESFDWKDRTGFQIFRKSITKGAYLRNLGDVIYFMPPYVITEDEMIKLVDIAHESIFEVL
ncbi:adenosylmethionine-8-amino-7-oxononanoate aminotransferase [Denitrovibrio acetiphilus DSM 12809]|uniref:Adenosylmethionine-8-amino-7-oxononanoate aminotransferase n=1 Tax=Denitrovibrio acetiphilus (strain DSM 12809 / NBRC 114555 / N2460) TaxID=522772 RepID=D4H782_DENA2|nr:adenosylmethionine--8-amino-7-oxononanoate transaminase [Denitrovibrio acetiphilus]ADD67881.1 adenosylmethionine-8-amino-7-oxononanoate aminotransferase [Denitrovibrio acetiphilus DSM 12809]